MVIGNIDYDIVDPNVWWIKTAEFIRCAGRETFGQTSGRKGPKRTTWWWNDAVRIAVTVKKEAKKKMDLDRSEENKKIYKEARRRAKVAVLISKQDAEAAFYSRIQEDEGNSYVFKVARIKDRKSKDVTSVRQVIFRTTSEFRKSRGKKWK
ncbi:hypothetical protein ACOME3_006452 [Neoechinorhynchus agilis]